MKKRVIEFVNSFSTRIPFFLQYVFFLPIVYAVKTLGAVQYETTRFVNLTFPYLKYNKIYGDYAEFGVFKGDTTIEVTKAARKTNSEMDFYLFDSFEGLPEITKSDLSGPFYAGEFMYSLDQFLKRMKRNKVNIDKLKIVKGYYSNSLKDFKYENVKFSYVFIDCDLKESTSEALTFIQDKLVQGAILAFDDFYCFGGPELGERGAISEWLELNPHFELTSYNNFHWAGKSFIFYDTNKA